MELTELSQQMNQALCHAPEQYQVDMHQDGSVEVTDLAKALNTSESVIHKIVDEDSSGHYAVVNGRVWATEGHSIPITIELDSVDSPGTIYHGTTASKVGTIREWGIVPGSRLFVHLSSDEKIALSAARQHKNIPVVLSIDGNAMQAAGLKFYKTLNDVILTQYVPWSFVTSVIVYP